MKYKTIFSKKKIKNMDNNSKKYIKAMEIRSKQRQSNEHAKCNEHRNTSEVHRDITSNTWWH
jgi:hypothetical protein